MKKQMFKRVGSVALSGALLSGVIFTSAFAAGSSSWSGSGTEADPYLITSQAGLEKIASDISAGNTHAGDYFKLTVDLQLGSDWTGIGDPTLSSASTNSPYVSSGNGFAGTFDGNNQIIVVSRTATTDGVGGVFNYVAPGGVVKNLGVTGTVSVTCPTTDKDGVNAVGGVVAYNCGVIDGVKSTVNVECTGSVYNVGGIAGFNDAYYVKGATGTIRNSTYGKTVTSTLPSTTTYTVEGYEKVGGIVGQNAGIVAACSNGGTIKTTATRKAGVGGIVGRNGNNDTAVETGTIVNCWNTQYGVINVGEASWGGGIAGFSNSLSKIAYCYNDGTLVTTSTGSTGSLKFYDTGYICGDLEGSASNCFTAVKEEEGTDYAAMGIADGTATWLTVYQEAAEITNGTLLDALKKGSTTYSNYGTWSAASNDYPVCTGASVIADTANGWSANTKTVYLDGTATTDGDGSESSPYNSLSEAVTAANGGTVVITGTVTLASGSYFDAVNFVAGNKLSDSMFEVTTGTVTFGSAKIAGGDATVFEVTGGNLRLRSGLKITSSNIAVDIANGGTATVNYTTIDADEYSFQVANGGKLIWCDFGSSGSPTINVTSGDVYLASGAYITVWDSIYSKINVESAVTKSGTEIAVGSGYKLTESDLGFISMVGRQVLTLDTEENTIIIK